MRSPAVATAKASTPMLVQAARYPDVKKSGATGDRLFVIVE